MAIEDLRKEWQKFKKAYPEFEKNKAYKADVGPQFDTLNKITGEVGKQFEVLSSKCDDAIKLLKNLEGALGSYEVVVNQLKGSDKTIAKDFAMFPDAVEDLSGQYTKARKDLDRISA